MAPTTPTREATGLWCVQVPYRRPLDSQFRGFTFPTEAQAREFAELADRYSITAGQAGLICHAARSMGITVAEAVKKFITYSGRERSV